MNIPRNGASDSGAESSKRRGRRQSEGLRRDKNDPRSIYFEVVARLRMRMLWLETSFASFGGLQPCRSPVRIGT